MGKNDIIETIFMHTREVIPALKGYHFQTNDSLKDLGANSIERSEIIAMTIESLSLDIPLTDMFGTNNIGELADTLFENLQRR